MTFRGSRMHVLDWVQGTGEPFDRSLDSMIAVTGFRVREGCSPVPKSVEHPVEARLGKDCGGVLTADQNRALLDWWLVNHRGANVPNWDLVCRARTSDGRDGVILVEAKANVPEFAHGEAGKAPGNVGNDEQIARAISEARDALCADGWQVGISRHRWYQVSNRVAFAWKLASMGVPTVLIYLGFTGDEGIRDAGEPLRDEEHWRSVVSAQDVIPAGMWEREIRVAGTPLWLLMRSLPAVRHSPPRVSRAGKAESYSAA